MPRRGRSKEEPKKKAETPDKLARPFEAAMKAIKAQQKAEAEAEEKARAEATRTRTEAERARAEAIARAASAKKAAAGKPARTARAGDPVSGYAYDDRAAFHQAFADVRPLARTRTERRSGQAPPPSDAEKRERAAAKERAEQAEQAARSRLDALVAGSVRFFVDRDRDGAVYGRRSDVADRTLDALTAPDVTPRVRLDLHGQDEAGARKETLRFLREQNDRRVRDVLIVHGKGLHSEGGVGVLDQVVVRVLTESPMAPRVIAFATAPDRLGGLGALLVRLDGAR